MMPRTIDEVLAQQIGNIMLLLAKQEQTIEQLREQLADRTAEKKPDE